MKQRTNYVWYAGYGSNMFSERFMCYINGGQFGLGGLPLEGCADKTPPIDASEFRIPYEMFFAGSARGWKNSGIAFIKSTLTQNASQYTLARLWKVTWDQFLDIQLQEGMSYDMVLPLGHYGDGCPMSTLTSSNDRLRCNQPSNEYIQTIALGLRETFAFNSIQSSRYLGKLEGIEGKISMKELETIIKSAGVV